MKLTSGMTTSACLLVCLLLFSPATSFSSDDVLTMSRPTNEVKKEHKRLYPIAVWLGDRLHDHGVVKGDVLFDGNNNVDITSDLINSGAIDLVFETPYSALAIMDATGAVPLLVVTRDGAKEYHSVIFARTDSGITSLADLKGKTIVFEESGSTSAYHLPRKAITGAGMTLTPLASPEESPPADSVGYVFGGSELNITSWVFFGRADAGALSNLDWPAQDENPERFRKEFTIIHRTKNVPRMLLMARKDLDPALMEAIKRECIAMPSTPEGAAALKNYKINAFTPIDDPEAYIADLREVLPGISE